MTQQSPPPDGEPQLHCLLGQPLPPTLLEDARSLARLTSSAKDHLWDLMQPCIVRPMSREIGLQLSEFCRRHEVAEADLGRVIRGCRYLVREAASMNLPLDQFAEDVAALYGDPSPLTEALLAHYDETKQLVRAELFLVSLTNHGALLEDVDWRIDQISGSNDAPNLMLSIALLTLEYRDGHSRHRQTLQVPAAVLRKLHLISGALLKRLERVGSQSDS